ncbi:MAG TPA: acyltransferase family protein, partial [Ornithinibacter sp.]|nr:acyltransferase family protein [Ornithinibacter sp.]
MTTAAPHRRADIQGLRAVAVAGVVAAHVAGWPASGYFGVDVFFVISGFVITGVLLRDRQRRGRISFAAFYARRARRILPLALLVIALTVVVSAWALTGPRADQVRVDAVWAAAFLANWHFAAVGSDYFALGDAPSPLLHYWSLGVEEQFYLVWPWLVAAVLALAAARRSGRLVLGLVCGLVVAGSVAWAVVQVGSDATTAYYSSLTRAWELGVGAALACVPAAAVRLGAATRAVLSWTGLAVVLASFVLLPDLLVPVPGALVPAAGALLVLAAGIGEPVRGAVLLTTPVSRYLGDTSYGLYLWHFPLVVLLPTVLPVSTVEQVLVVVLTLVLATVSYYLLERPILDAPPSGAGSWRAWWVARRRGMIAAGTAAVCLVAAGIGVANAGPGAFDAVVDQPAAAPTATPAAADVAPPAPVPTSETTTPTPGPTTTTAAVVPLGPTGQALRDGLTKALAATSFPADLTPKPDQWATTADQSAAMKPCVATVASNPTSCTFGNPNGPEIDVVGDSLGLPQLAAVVAAYGKDYKIRGLTKIACAVNGVDANYGKDEWATPCVNHRKMVIDYVAKARPAAVLVIETYAWATRLKSKATGDALADEWIRADEAFTQALRQGTDHVVFVSASIPGVAFLDCYRAGGSPSRCVTGIPTWWQQTQDAERRVKGATFVDTLHWYCVDGRCPIFTTVHDTVLKGDYLHPSVQYMRLVADDLRYRLAA